MVNSLQCSGFSLSKTALYTTPLSYHFRSKGLTEKVFVGKAVMVSNFFHYVGYLESFPEKQGISQNFPWKQLLMENYEGHPKTISC